MVFAAPAPPPTATHRPRDGENVIDLTLPVGVLVISIVPGKDKPPSVER